ncbi:hypothetical protein CC78DRAFT_231713 [Lojkania enalia]|uniref:Uncharacterized protein n=1 Tax=Lojkania enalia TaxID=147567 RepID=A0A9P4N4C9_9PLEO|nr:hypothetical protein CC78DRAFT_231713 [Didymosphaeria enalia]
MADALCGPSNALQNFQKHTSVDRTPQQDRLTSRHSPAQNFRSSPGPNAGILDPEFEAFQAGNGHPPPAFHHLPPHFSHPPPPPQFAQASQAPDWAADFQRLDIGPAQSAPIQRPYQPQVSNAASSWHQDFLRHTSPVMQAPIYQQPKFLGISGYDVSEHTGPTFQQASVFGVANHNPISAVALGKQRAREMAPEFDEAAFERAFAQAQQDILEEASTSIQETVAEHSRSVETDPIMRRIQEKRPPVYATIKLRSEVDLGKLVEAEPWLQDLESMESSGQLIRDATEAKWCVDALQKIVDREAPKKIKSRAEKLITSINERLMSAYPLLAPTISVNTGSVWEDLAAAGYTAEGYTTETPLFKQRGEQSEQKKEEQPLRSDDDEMAETAGRLLERVADNTSQKFQNSQFLELMRRLRDREVRIDGDKMVEVSSNQPSTSPLQPAPVPPPEVDPKILEHAHQEFGMVIDSEQEYGLSRSSSNDSHTDEVSAQFGYYNVLGKYHR